MMIKKTSRKSNPFMHSQEETPLATNHVANASVRFENRSDSSNKNSSGNSGRTTTDSYSPSSSSRSSIVNNFFTPDQAPSLSLNDSNSSNSTNCSIHPLIEGSLEYRELKPRPTAEVVEWIQELLDLMNNKTSFQGDGRILDTIVDDLGLDEVSFITVAARTPQESALKLFHLLYPTVISRANCGSISRVHQAQLNNIYMCVRHIHKNLSFSKNEMRKAIGTLIRSAKRELRRAQGTRQQLNVLQNDENLDPDENDENTNATSDMKAILDTTNDITDDDDEEKKDEDHNEDDDEYENKDEGEGEDEDEDEDGNFDKVNNLMIDEALDEDNEDDN
ncbi:unnamed protein product [Rotaria sordida]|uniref:Uncharacterized protein n=1 Tax=Rotaria sordida TaxID=392033 RepID=A0A819RUA2_9BILA|nr:unnamed protein product [Rotaria sordida]CAF4050706.1 unnamed protein product [Rotaria sordida]